MVRLGHITSFWYSVGDIYMEPSGLTENIAQQDLQVGLVLYITLEICRSKSGLGLFAPLE